MATVTRLSPAGMQGEQVSIELDGTPFAVVPARVGERLSLTEGDGVDRAALAERIERAESEMAMERALHLLSYRARTREEIRRRLLREGYRELRIRSLLERLEETGLVDDGAFCAAYMRGRLNARPEGTRLVAEGLYRRGIERDQALAVIARVLEEEGLSERDLLERAAEKKLRSLSRLPPARARRRLFEHLARRGFPLGEVRALVGRVLGG